MSRIIAGSHKGRRLTTPRGDTTRPTTDRVREALFSAFAVWADRADRPAEESLRGLALADLYAGSGAVGLEAASRGADAVLLVESASAGVAVIQRNIAELGLRGSVSLRTDRVERLARTPAPRAYDLIFLDPPYELGAEVLGAVLADLVAHGWVHPDALVVVERSRRNAVITWPPGFEPGWRRDYGETTLLFGFVPDPADAADGDSTRADAGGGP